MPNTFTQRMTDNFKFVPESDIRNVHGAPGWIELTTPEPHKACEFLAAVFGWTFHMIQVGGADYWLIQVKGHEVGGVRRPLPGTPNTPSWATYITVEDVDMIAQNAESAGGTVVIPPTELPGVGRLVGVEHPHGGRLLGFEYARPFE
jgi:predicted enzyme related to lactoylglutathione lyase